MTREKSHVPAAAQPVRILTVPALDGAVVLFTGPILGLLTHWHQGRSVSCPGAENCLPAIHRSRTIWKGYASVRAWSKLNQHWIAAVLEVTEGLEEILRGRELQGQVWFLTRDTSKRKSGPVTGVYLEQKVDDRLIRPFDLRPALQRLYHTPQLALGVPNPVPPKMLVEPIAGEAPACGLSETPVELPRATSADLEKLKQALYGRAKIHEENGKR